LLETLYAGFDRALLKDHMALLQTPAVAEVTAALNALDIMRSYAVSDLLNTYVPGSREWLYAKLEAWLQAVAPLPAGSTQHSPAMPEVLDSKARMFLLMAGPGMGKSVFSAIARSKLVVRSTVGAGVVTAQHFFKIGQPRAQGKLMVLCIAHQLAERLPGLAELLVPVVEKHGSASELSMAETFEK
jgi:hypothetical protein